jgi:hypothetical protein
MPYPPTDGSSRSNARAAAAPIQKMIEAEAAAADRI